ncbi:hypothetical protein Y695_04295 [Hydrogenophaga sp. T4]|nr:hypothetical protein Y695_04295 [Hydrogenophaga sp. T4]
MVERPHFEESRRAVFLLQTGTRSAAVYVACARLPGWLPMRSVASGSAATQACSSRSDTFCTVSNSVLALCAYTGPPPKPQPRHPRFLLFAPGRERRTCQSNIRPTGFWPLWPTWIDGIGLRTWNGSSCARARPCWRPTQPSNSCTFPWMPWWGCCTRLGPMGWRRRWRWWATTAGGGGPLSGCPG